MCIRDSYMGFVFKVKNEKLGNCEKCGKEIFRFGTPFVVEESNIIYKN